MASCGLCAGFTLVGPICAMCANTITGSSQTISVDGNSVKLANVFAIQDDKVKDAVWDAILEKHTASLKTGGAAARKYALAGALANAVYAKGEISFFDTVTFGGDGSAESIWGGRTAFHRTKPGSGSFTVVYTRAANGDIQVIGTGGHVGSGNDSYMINFDDGSRKRCSR